MVEQGTIHVTYILTNDIVADTLTKALLKDQYWKFMRMLGLHCQKEETIAMMEGTLHTC